MFFSGREPETSYLRLDNAGVQIDPESRKILVNENEQTTMSNIYGIGDVINVCFKFYGRPVQTKC